MGSETGESGPAALLSLLILSVIHLDYVRSDIALDHGSDRFSTFNDFDCGAVAKPDRAELYDFDSLVDPHFLNNEAHL